MPVTPDHSAAEAGRLLMANELSIIQTSWPELRLSAETKAVHETRKAIRRTFTLFRLFAPYFAAKELEPHRTALRKLMRRLAPCRDAAVFRLKLDAYNAAADSPLIELAEHWSAHQTEVDRRLRHYLSRKSVGRNLERYSRFTNTQGMGLPGHQKPAPVLVRHVLPALIFQRIATVRAWGDILPEATPRQFHQLRIQFKELRYTLTFFEDILSNSGGEIIDLSRRIQEHLGNLNDASVAIEFLAEQNQVDTKAGIYKAYQESELARLTAEFMPLYAEFNQPEVRRNLAVTLANL